MNYGTIENSSISGNITGVDFIGGIVGWNPSGSISNTVAAGNVRGRDYTGGFVGNNTGNIQRSYAIGSVTGNNLIGGFVGFNKGTIQNSYSLASVIGNNLVGGFARVNDPGTIINSYSAGKVTGNSNVRGFARINEGIVENSYYDESINPGFIEGYGNKGLRTALLYDFNIFYESDWDIVVDPSLPKGYPILAWQKGRNDFVWLISDKGETPQLPEDPGVVPQEAGNPNGPDLPTDTIQNSGKTISEQGPTDASICYDENGMVSDAVSNNLSRLNSDMKSVLICKKI